MFPLDTSTRAGRMMEAGRVTVTFRSIRTGEHITILAKARGKDANDRWTATPLAEALVVFFEVPNQEGWNDKVGKFTSRGSFIADRLADHARVFCAKRLLDFVAGRPMPDGIEALEEGAGFYSFAADNEWILASELALNFRDRLAHRRGVFFFSEIGKRFVTKF